MDLMLANLDSLNLARAAILRRDTWQTLLRRQAMEDETVTRAMIARAARAYQRAYDACRNAGLYV